MKIAVCFGGNKGMFLERFAVRDIILEIAKQKDKDIFLCGNNEIKYFYSYGLRSSKGLSDMKSENPHFVFPETSDVVISKIKHYGPDIVLFFGVAGSLSNNDVNKVVHPTHFLAYEFSDNIFIHEEQVNPSSKVSIRNILKGSFERGKTVLSTNVAIAPESCGAGRHVHLWKDRWSDVERVLHENNFNLSGKHAVNKYIELSFHTLLKKFSHLGIDLVEAESYAFARSFHNIGISLQVSDVPGKHSYSENNLSSSVFKHQFLKAIKKVLIL